MPDLRQLRVFVAVAEELNFTRAAEQLHLGQQAVSKSVRRSSASCVLGDLDGERLLVWNPPGTPYTDLILDRLRAGGATVEPLESRVVGTAR